MTDICEELVRRGHEVSIVTGVPNYPEGKIYPGYERGKRREETVNGVVVHRCWTIPRKTGALWRCLNYLSFPLSSSLYVRSKACCASDGGLFDVVFVNQLSPVMMANAGVAYKKKHHVPIVLYCLDLWPESLAAGGIRRGSAIYRVFHRISERIYTQIDRILVTSRMFTSYLNREFGLDKGAVAYIPQYAEGLFKPLPYKDTGSYDFVFAGNVGALQSVDTILRAVATLKNEPVRFHIVGGGSELERLKSLSRELSLENVTFYGRRPLEEMPKYYAMADAMLVTLKADPVLSLTLPGKVQSYMAVGKPIIGAIDGEAVEVIRRARCGFCGPAENVETLAENIRRFVASKDKRQMGENARTYYDQQFAQERIMDALEQELTVL